MKNQRRANEKQALTPLEFQLLRGQTMTMPRSTNPILTERYLGLMALANQLELQAEQHFLRSGQYAKPQSLDWAIAERLRGLSLIRALREVEGTFALERSDEILQNLGYELFGL